MDKNLKDTISAAKNLQKEGLIYLNDSIDLEVEPNYQILAMIIHNLNDMIDREKYELVKNDEKKLIHELALLNFNENDLICDDDVEIMENMTREYIDILDPILYEDVCVFFPKAGKLAEIYGKASTQIEEGKFKNIIF
ncbi:hypothetical protein Ccar_24330 [Clostridium carboxidivorans P7]|uniref:Uncharacterized protein n=1 Tax=Clostridium carboxidivorans P7 TaxID=536227 RepID=C6PV70_9CLOT|nr:hypothetical protein [Clostridium carboxidivorans]AKN33782.1 hypothetical protein Ccar_24330 [Clostridium carboxidivorans P7]EET86888.1 hypothetical protein CcarbDRAFT_2687 [Clostridium carboxidivorans P7]EFG86609.1 hypothetical protein CLCAR_3556 [Clostridium carboxidivorans P7]